MIKKLYIFFVFMVACNTTEQKGILKERFNQLNIDKRHTPGSPYLDNHVLFKNLFLLFDGELKAFSKAEQKEFEGIVDDQLEGKKVYPLNLYEGRGVSIYFYAIDSANERDFILQTLYSESAVDKLSIKQKFGFTPTSYSDFEMLFDDSFSLYQDPITGKEFNTFTITVVGAPVGEKGNFTYLMIDEQGKINLDISFEDMP